MKIDDSDITVTHHWMFRMRGGEKVLQEICALFPGAKIGCLAFDRKGLTPEINHHEIIGSWFQRFSLTRRMYKELLPLHPTAIRRMTAAKDAKLVVCSDASMIKGMPVADDATLVCYCHSPPRYIWEMADTYASKDAGMGSLAQSIFKFVIPFCRKFDRFASKRVDLFIANSNFVASRIKKFYGRESIVIHPPVDFGEFDFDRDRSDFFLVVSELVPYKRIDIAIEAFNANGRPLVVIGDGPERERLEAMAESNIRFLGRQSFSVLKEHYETCRAFVFPGLEDFGITPLEAQAAGAPIIAFGKGGALETVVDNQTGVFFEDQTAKSLNFAVEEVLFMAQRFGAQLSSQCRRNAEAFGAERFRREMFAEISRFLEANGRMLDCSTEFEHSPTLKDDAVVALTPAAIADAPQHVQLERSST